MFHQPTLCCSHIVTFIFALQSTLDVICVLLWLSTTLLHSTICDMITPHLNHKSGLFNPRVLLLVCRSNINIKFNYDHSGKRKVKNSSITNIHKHNHPHTQFKPLRYSTTQTQHSETRTTFTHFPDANFAILKMYKQYIIRLHIRCELYVKTSVR